MSETVRIYESDLEAVEQLTNGDKPMPARMSEVVRMAVAWEERGSDVL